MNSSTGKKLFGKVKMGNEQAFEALFHAYYKSLCYYAKQILNDEKAAEEITQDIFVKLWEKRLLLNINTSIKNYLFRSVKNACLNLIQHNKIKSKYSGSIHNSSKQNTEPSNYFIEIELAEKIEAAIKSLPDKRREIFRLSQEEGLKYKEIAERLKISIKTVETQIGLALKTLRNKLKDYNPNSILFYLFFNSS
jgi:RNA polymerase sigma-70 factor (ECF subfamily)